MQLISRRRSVRRTVMLAAIACLAVLLGFSGATPVANAATSLPSWNNGGNALMIMQAASGAISLPNGGSECAGLQQITITSNVPAKVGHDVELFRLRGITLTTLRQTLAKIFNPKTPGPVVGNLTQNFLNHHITLYGGYQDQAPGTYRYDVVLRAGQYYIIDVPSFIAGAPAVSLRLSGSSDADLPDAGQRVLLAPGVTHDQFLVHGTRSHPRPTITTEALRVTNRDDSLHFIQFQPVKVGTTDQQVQAFFDSNGKTANPFRPGDTPGSGVFSPGVSILIIQQAVSPGWYVLVCFMPDRATGMPHALMGMHRVIIVMHRDTDMPLAA